jgi:hypothetical protein
MKRFSQTLKVVLAVFLTVFSSGLAQLYTAPEAKAAPKEQVTILESVDCLINVSPDTTIDKLATLFCLTEISVFNLSFIDKSELILFDISSDNETVVAPFTEILLIAELKLISDEYLTDVSSDIEIDKILSLLILCEIPVSNLSFIDESELILCDISFDNDVFVALLFDKLFTDEEIDVSNDNLLDVSEFIDDDKIISDDNLALLSDEILLLILSSLDILKLFSFEITVDTLLYTFVDKFEILVNKFESINSLDDFSDDNDVDNTLSSLNLIDNSLSNLSFIDESELILCDVSLDRPSFIVVSLDNVIIVLIIELSIDVLSVVSPDIDVDKLVTLICLIDISVTKLSFIDKSELILWDDSLDILIETSALVAEFIFKIFIDVDNISSEDILFVVSPEIISVITMSFDVLNELSFEILSFKLKSLLIR